MDSAELDRRRFLLATLSGAAAVGGALLAPGEGVARRRRRGQGGYAVYISCRIRVSGCTRYIVGINLTTPSKALAGFLRSNKELAGIQSALKQAVAGISCRDLATNSRRAKWDLRTAKALRKHYKKRTGKRVSTLKARLAVHEFLYNPGFPARVAFP